MTNKEILDALEEMYLTTYERSDLIAEDDLLQELVPQLVEWVHLCERWASNTEGAPYTKDEILPMLLGLITALARKEAE